MKVLRMLVVVAAALSACGEPDCPDKSGYNQCGYCDLDRVTSSNPHAGMCTYCTGTCVSKCDPCGDGGGGGGCDASWVSSCGRTVNGIQFIGQPWPQSCGSCPSGTHQSGVDNVTAGGPYYLCTCNGF